MVTSTIEWLNRVHFGRCEDRLPLMAADGVRVQLVVTSPPYNNLRRYGDDDGWSFERTAAGLLDVLDDGAVVCWNVGDSVVNGGEQLTPMRQAIYFVDVLGLRMHDTMIYERLNFSHPEKVRYHQMFEYVFILSKGAPRCFNPIKDKPNVYSGSGTYGKNTARAFDGVMFERPRNINAEFGMRGNVWRGKTRGQEEMCESLPHPAMMPKWLARDLIVSWSNPGDIVLDPFMGSGTTAEQAQHLGRHWIGLELYRKFSDAQLSCTRQAGMPL